MARKTLVRSITFTEVKLAEIKMVDGSPEVKELPNETLIGNVSMEKAQRMLAKKYPNATVLEVAPETKKYSIDLLDFIEYAEVVEEKEEKGRDK